MKTDTSSDRSASSGTVPARTLSEMLASVFAGLPRVECFRIRFKSGDLHHAWGDAEFVLVGGAISTRETFEAFRESMCHLCDDGIIRRYGMPIGVKDDIEILGPMDEPMNGEDNEGHPSDEKGQA